MSGFDSQPVRIRIKKTVSPGAGRFGDPARIRTWDLRLRRPLLYPAELQDRLIRRYKNIKISPAKKALPQKMKLLKDLFGFVSDFCTIVLHLPHHRMRL